MNPIVTQTSLISNQWDLITKRNWCFIAIFSIIVAAPAGLSGCFLLRETEVTISWTTESELDIIGFNMYRSQSPYGPFGKVNEVLIPPAADPSVGGSHSYVDYDVESGITYYYQLETVDRYGNITRSETIAVTAGN